MPVGGSRGSRLPFKSGNAALVASDPAAVGPLRPLDQTSSKNADSLQDSTWAAAEALKGKVIRCQSSKMPKFCSRSILRTSGILTLLDNLACRGLYQVFTGHRLTRGLYLVIFWPVRANLG